MAVAHRHHHQAAPALDKLMESSAAWPYRTTPLVLPGAKVKKEDTVTDCYLRHHPNPLMRAPPGHGGDWLPADVVMKQKVADSVLQRVVPSDPHRHVVNKPFNTPIGLYSEKNIVDTIHKTLGTPVVYPPPLIKY